MPRYTAKERGFFGDRIIEPGETITTDRPLNPIPKWLKKAAALSAEAQKEVDAAEAAKTAEAEEAAKEVKTDIDEVIVEHGAAPETGAKAAPKAAPKAAKGKNVETLG